MGLGRVQTFLVAVVIGSAVTALMVWLFDIDIVTLDKLRAFPDGWHIMDLVTNVLAALIFFGSIRVVDRAIWTEMGGGRRDTDGNGEGAP